MVGATPVAEKTRGHIGEEGALKITNVGTAVVEANCYLTFIGVHTDKDVSGLGESCSSPGSLQGGICND